MIKTEKLIKHTICCPYCGCNIQMRDSNANEFDLAFQATRRVLSNKMPTCTGCKKKFEVKFDANNFTIELKDV